MKPATIDELNALIGSADPRLMKDCSIRTSTGRQGQALSDEAKRNLSAARRGLYTEAQRAACKARMANPTPAMLEARRKAVAAWIAASRRRGANKAPRKTERVAQGQAKG